MADKKSRGKKTSTQQQEVIIEMLRKNRCLITGKTHPNSTSEVEEKWEELVVVLNSTCGAKKDKQQWKNFLSEWKSKVKKKARIHKENITKTGGGGYMCKDLTDIENRLLQTIGWVSITGCTDLPVEIDPLMIHEDCEKTEFSITTDNDLMTYLGIDKDVTEVVLTSHSTENNLQEEIPIVIETEHTIPKKSKACRKSPQLGNLDKSAQLYADSVAVMAKSIETMAESLVKLPESITLIANALLDMNTGKQ